MSRLLEQFWTDEEITAFIETGEIPDKDSYANRVILCDDWIISVADYKEVLETILNNVPKRWSKRKAKSMLQMVDFYMWPKTFELADQIKQNAHEPQ